jgi:GrpB-like predicted nucleotidyltransferase (UPF0157 family)
MVSSTTEKNDPVSRAIEREAYRLRLVEDFVSTKVRRLQFGRPTKSDHAALSRVHERALENVAAIRRHVGSSSLASTGGAIGLHYSAVEVVAYDPGWPALFTAEAEMIRQRLGPLEAKIHHVGSTSIPGMPAKPLIDIAVSVEPAALRDRLADYIAAMDATGYRFFGDFGHRGGYYFSKLSGRIQTFTAQFHASDSWDLKRLLGFRDAARTDPGLFREYSEVKIALASALGRNRGIYYWYKGHWLNDRLLTERGPTAWGTWFLLAQYPTMFRMGVRHALSIMRPKFAGKGLHPMAVRRRKPVSA